MNDYKLYNITMIENKRDLRLAEHIQIEHKQNRFSHYIREILFGGIDGIITTFAVIAGFSGAALSNEATTQLSFVVVLLFGLANLLADGVSMGLGNFLSVRSDQSLYKEAQKKEEYEIDNNTELEIEETVTILMQKGFNEEDSNTLANLYKKNKKYWVTFMMNHELEMPDPHVDNPIYTGLATFLAFIFFGFIPLIPFMILVSVVPKTVFLYSSVMAFVALILLGILKWRMIGSRPIRSVFEVVVVGVIAGGIAFGVGSLFSL